MTQWYIPVLKNCEQVSFLMWLDTLHPAGADICYQTITALNLDTEDATEFTNEHTQDQWDRHRTVLWDLLGMNAVLDVQEKELYFVAETAQLSEFSGIKYPKN